MTDTDRDRHPRCPIHGDALDAYQDRDDPAVWHEYCPTCESVDELALREANRPPDLCGTCGLVRCLCQMLDAPIGYLVYTSLGYRVACPLCYDVVRLTGRQPARPTPVFRVNVGPYRQSC